jgi:hypothetical protein
MITGKEAKSKNKKRIVFIVTNPDYNHEKDNGDVNYWSIYDKFCIGC